MKLLIDGDGCPVVDLALKISKKHRLEAIIFCDSSHWFQRPGAQTVMVMQGKDAVDFELLKYIEKNDVVITQDYGLAAMALAKGGRPLSQNGLFYTKDNIDQLLESRLAAFKARKAGKRMKGPKKRSQEDDLKFEAALLELLKK